MRGKVRRTDGSEVSDFVYLEVPTQPAATNQAFPVNAVFVTIDPTNPASTLGYGTWSSVGAGQVLVGVSPGDPDFGAVGQAGGFKTITITDHVDHTHQVTSNVTTTPATVQSGAGAVVVGSGTNNTVTSAVEVPVLKHVDGRTAASAIPILQPYVCVYFWLRTA